MIRPERIRLARVSALAASCGRWGYSIMKVFPVTEEIAEGDGTRVWLSDGRIIYLPPIRSAANKGRYKLEGMVLHAVADRSAAPNPETVREFLRHFHYYAARATDGLEQPGSLQMSRQHPNEEKIIPDRYRIGDLEVSIDVALASAAHSNVWIEGRTVGGLQGTQRGTVEDTRWVFALVIDSDNDKGMAGRR
jgi:hypothetical protein